MKKRQRKFLANHTILTLCFVIVLAFLGWVIAQAGPPNPGHSLNQIAGIPSSDCASGQVLTKSGGVLTCTTLPTQPLVFGEAFPINTLSTNYFIATTFQAVDSSSPTYNGYLNIAMRGNGGGSSYSIGIYIIDAGEFPDLGGLHEGVILNGVHGVNIGSAPPNDLSRIGSQEYNLIGGVPNGGKGARLFISGADKSTKIKIRVINNDNVGWRYREISYGMNKFLNPINGWGNTNEEFEFYLAR